MTDKNQELPPGVVVIEGAALHEFQRNLARSIGAKVKEPAKPDVWDPDRLPFGVPPKGNKLGFDDCPFCKKPASDVPSNEVPGGKAFLFRDHLSAAEYRITGLCQACQDATFGAEDNDGESDP